MITKEELIALGLAAGYNDIVAVARAEKYLENQETFYSWYAPEKSKNYDPTPWCTWCGSMTKTGCDCGPIADNH